MRWLIIFGQKRQYIFIYSRYCRFSLVKLDSEIESDKLSSAQ